MSDQHEDYEKIIASLLIRATKVVELAEKAHEKLNVMFKILLGSVLLAIVTVSGLGFMVKTSKSEIDSIKHEYAPLWFVHDLNENTNFAIKEIAIVFADSVDRKKLDVLMIKYKDFATNSLTRLAQIKGATNYGKTRAYRPSVFQDSITKEIELRKLEAEYLKIMNKK